MGNAMLLSSAYGWFVGLLIVMIVVTALFAFILWIALETDKRKTSSMILPRRGKRLQGEKPS